MNSMRMFNSELNIWCLKIEQNIHIVQFIHRYLTEEQTKSKNCVLHVFFIRNHKEGAKKL